MRTTTMLLAAGLLAAAPAPASSQDPGRGAPPRLPGVAAPRPATRLEDALREFRATGEAAIIPPARPGEFTAFPYGYAQPYLRCAALKVCQVELQPGEALTDDPIPGDRERWDVDRTARGNTTVVLVKPKECDVSTNLVIPTDRRGYVVDLEAPPCTGTNPRGAYMAGIRFWYPDEAVRAQPTPAVRESGRPQLTAVNTRYTWTPSAGVSWNPARVFDDGKRTVVQFAPAARDGALPVFYALADDGSREQVNTVVRPDPAGDLLVTDRVVRRAVLVLRDGRHERRVEIVNRSTEGR